MVVEIIEIRDEITQSNFVQNLNIIKEMIDAICTDSYVYGTNGQTLYTNYMSI